ncbi:hypothetical protein J437_LFUL006149 [Ladona fulva]|uniref:Transmembrane protein 18 n=1 Tax=Ladona fulva TaxID=123851 RepID=A0A8K0NX14_LADFU|nr:hypothetical protein J437_LFUL006149 [Ladona fulva]
MENHFIVNGNEIDSIWAFIRSIEWWDPWLIGLISFHIVITLMTLMTRDYGNFQVVLFLILCKYSVNLLTLSSRSVAESINEIAATNWSLFSRQQYFDSKGMFISLVFSVPILLNCMIMVANWLWQSSQLMLRVKQVQMRHQVESNNKQQKQNKSVKCQSQKPRPKSE